MTSTTTDSSRSPDATDLERRVLAHERILQSLIAYMSRTEPRFVNHLRDRFVEPMKMARREHEYRDVDDYAEEFIRAVMLIGETRLPAVLEEQVGAVAARAPELASSGSVRSPLEPDRVHIKERNGVWQVTVDGVFRGDYRKKEHALAAMALAKLSLQ